MPKGSLDEQELVNLYSYIYHSSALSNREAKAPTTAPPLFRPTNSMRVWRSRNMRISRFARFARERERESRHCRNPKRLSLFDISLVVARARRVTPAFFCFRFSCETQNTLCKSRLYRKCDFRLRASAAIKCAVTHRTRQIACTEQQLARACKFTFANRNDAFRTLERSIALIAS